MAKPEAAALYRVVFSEAVARRLSGLSDEAAARGDGPEFAAALKAFRERLAVYPQFGDPQIDLKAEPGVIRVGIIRPLSMRYGVYEGLRLVLVVAPPVLLPMDKMDASSGE